ncbi:hypothetical protein [Dokdonella sp.]|nr:hypothetical protein [Dokdonella sp.]
MSPSFSMDWLYWVSSAAPSSGSSAFQPNFGGTMGGWFHGGPVN